MQTKHVFLIFLRNPKLMSHSSCCFYILLFLAYVNIEALIDIRKTISDLIITFRDRIELNITLVGIGFEVSVSCERIT